MSDRWVVDKEYPDGHLVPMTDSEQAQLRADQKTHATAATREAAERAAAAETMDVLEQARADLADGAIFGWLSSAERRVLDALIAATVPVRT